MKKTLSFSTKNNQITLLLPAETPIPVIGGVYIRTETGLTQVSGKRYYRKKNGAIEATYDLETLRFAIGMIEASHERRN